VSVKALTPSILRCSAGRACARHLACGRHASLISSDFLNLAEFYIMRERLLTRREAAEYFIPRT
jgi:hypothetical protein